ncbi:MAG TPA: glutamate-1-semialdehyde 2,1-aminomutase, partial [Limnochordia bacterium]
LGHAHPRVVEAVQAAAAAGTSYGAPTRAEVRLAELVVEAVPGIERFRLVNSGTEATMSALRLARAVTGRELVLKFAGGYHGHVDALLIKAGSGVTTFGLPDSPGVPEAVAATTLLAPYNDLNAVEATFATHGERVAAVIVEPVAGNMGVVPPAPGFLAGLRELTRRFGALLIFDEVITGFRVGRGGAQAKYGIVPDLTCLGKILGGGLPIGGFGGPASIMDALAPEGPVYQAGTLSGNPIAVAAGIATLEALSDESVYAVLEERTARLARGLVEAARMQGLEVCLNRVGSMATLFFTRGPVTDYETARRADARAYAAFFRHLLAQGIYFPPSQFEAFFVSLAHTDADIDETVEKAADALARAARAADQA